MSNITKEYHKLLEEILKNGRQKSDRTGTGTRSIFSYQIKADMQDGFPLITTKRLHTRSIVHELLWFLQGNTNTKYLNENGVTIWDEWADENGDLGPVYGSQWVNWKGFDHGWHDVAKVIDGDEKPHQDYLNGINQIQNAINTLKNNPDSRRIMVSAWNVGELYQMALPPCHWAFELYTEELTREERFDLLHKEADGSQIPWDRMAIPHHEWMDEVTTLDTYSHDFELNKGKTIKVPRRRLHLKWHQRSVDTFLGLPFNIASYAMLLHMFAQQTNMIPGTLIGDLSNVHIYDNHISYVEEQITLRDPKKYNLPKFILNKSESMFDYKFEDFVFENYEYYPNWKNVPIAV
jgi:thymidylate synthase